VLNAVRSNAPASGGGNKSSILWGGGTSRTQQWEHLYLEVKGWCLVGNEHWAEAKSPSALLLLLM